MKYWLRKFYKQHFQKKIVCMYCEKLTRNYDKEWPSVTGGYVCLDCNPF